MGQDYSYSQPSSSDVDMDSLLLEEAELYADEAQSSYNAEPVQYEPDPEADDGIPTRCYCGGEPVVGTSTSSKHPYRRYYTCPNVDDGDCHIWKWWDVAVVEELRDFQREFRQLTEQVSESERKLVKLEESVAELSKKKPVASNGLEVVACLLVSLIVIIGLVVFFLPGKFLYLCFDCRSCLLDKTMTILSLWFSGGGSNGSNESV
ncbi:uncharacterized protein At1g43920, Chloroplastic-like [Raphanus sativus]|uniref:Uncharacterized protein At1g43920, Chloroplastic-like n=1 Tax=Raphanus sativus TaxID=3726 RepID=A0A9W3D8I4_RAPSA|nr:uncharacterized protein At1g43920, Chloroplastic-like [Raphanus sativus]